MLNIVISTQQSDHHEWRAFACWYSTHRNSSESKIAVIFPRSYKHHQFHWLNKCHVPYLTYSSESNAENAINILIENEVLSLPIIILQDHQMIIRELETKVEGIIHAETLPCYADCSSEEIVTIVDYQKCGKFNLKDWEENEQKHPFYRTLQLIGRNRTVNEQRVFQLWKQMAITFDFVNRN